MIEYGRRVSSNAKDDQGDQTNGITAGVVYVVLEGEMKVSGVANDRERLNPQHLIVFCPDAQVHYCGSELPDSPDQLPRQHSLIHTSTSTACRSANGIQRSAFRDQLDPTPLRDSPLPHSRTHSPRAALRILVVV